MTAPFALAFFTLAVLAPVPFVHLVLHLFLSAWRRRPTAFYLLAASLWGVAAPLAWRLASGATRLFVPSPWAVRIGLALGIGGFALVTWCVVTLGPRRFFMWPVLRPEPGPAERVTCGPYRFLTHPTYVSLVATLLGHFLASGMTVLLGGAAILGGLLTLVTTLEERELARRVATSPSPEA